MAPDLPSRSVVPPTLTTLGETAGQMVPAPLSPEAATNVTPGVVKKESQLVSPGTSGMPQLIDTTDAPVRVAAYWTAFSKSVGSPVTGSRASDAADTSTMLARGAIAWAHSTSRAVSSVQLSQLGASVPLLRSIWVNVPFPLAPSSAGRPKRWLKTVKSFWMLGLK